MKGHLGFRCRYCQRPSPPTNVRQLGVGIRGDTLRATLAWDAPADPAYVDPIVQYKIEEYTTGVGWQEVYPSSGPIPRSAVLTFCDGGSFRVSAANRCGWGDPAYYSSWIFSGGGSTGSLVTSSASLQPPCWSTSVKVWCVGCGGTFSGGGGGGGLAWKTWTRNQGESWNGDFVCVVRNAANQAGPALASVSHAGSTVIGYGGSAAEAGYFSGGDGGASGAPGGTGYGRYSGLPHASITYPFSGAAQFTGNYTFGGGIGGANGTNQDGSYTYPSPVSPCRRHPAINRSGLLDAVSLLGVRVTEECSEEPAFGSGGVTFTMPVYGGSQRVDFTAGYGGGGFDSTSPGGPGCIVVKYT